MIMRARVLLALDTSGGVVDPKEVIAALLCSNGRKRTIVELAGVAADSGLTLHNSAPADERTALECTAS
jgi:hypothetical protein